MTFLRAGRRRAPAVSLGTIASIGAAAVLFLTFFSTGLGDRGAARLRAQSPPTGEAGADLARIKQEEARQKLQSLEQSMERLARMLAVTEPQNAAKLRSAFHASRERLLREGMDRVIRFIEEKKLDRAVEDQSGLSAGLEELLSILLEKDIDPRELLRHIREVRDTLASIDQVVREETAEKLASDEATAAEAEVTGLGEAVAKLDDLIRRQQDVEAGARAADKADPEADPAPALAGLAGAQEGVRKDTEALREASAAAPPSDGAGEDGKGQDGKGQDGKGEAGKGEAKAGGGDARLDGAKLAEAASAMAGAAGAMKGGNSSGAAGEAQRARQALEAARADAAGKLDRARARRDFAAMKREQDATRDRTDAIVERMKKPVPLVSTPEGGLPGREDVESASSSMSGASESLAAGQASGAGQSQKQALDQLGAGQRQVEETLEALQRALRERILAYLRERFTHMLEEQKKIARDTQSLDSRLRALALARGADPEAPAATPAATPAGTEAPDAALLDRRDLQRAEDLSRREARLGRVAEDIQDLLEEDGTTLVFPRIVEELRRDVDNITGRLAGARTDALTQRIEQEVITTIEEILEAIKEAQRSPPPPNPNQGRQSKSGAGPLLPASAELKMVRSMQQRVNQRTRDFDLSRPAELDLDGQRQAKLIAERQNEIEDLFRKLAAALSR